MSYAGKVFAYKVSKDGSLSNLGILTAPEVQRAASFGQGITLSSDTLVISANRSKVNDLTAAGAVHLWHIFPGIDLTQATHSCSGASKGDSFGNSISLSGDLLAIGAHFADPDGVDRAGKAASCSRSTSRVLS